MAEARQRSEWGRQSVLLSLLANVNRDPKRKPTAYKPADFDPFAVTQRVKKRGSVDDMRRFVKGGRS